ncbi:hypothetical protein [Kitasatospora sp. NPDC097643]|uniref:hypothetical protein n=1 Tax=Kitasatospora sp. NPDC097643 TaxID=3157230 RepID=UPI00332C3F8B
MAEDALDDDVLDDWLTGAMDVAAELPPKQRGPARTGATAEAATSSLGHLGPVSRGSPARLDPNSFMQLRCASG